MSLNNRTRNRSVVISALTEKSNSYAYFRYKKCPSNETVGARNPAKVLKSLGLKCTASRVTSCLPASTHTSNSFAQMLHQNTRIPPHLPMKGMFSTCSSIGRGMDTIPSSRPLASSMRLGSASARRDQPRAQRHVLQINPTRTRPSKSPSGISVEPSPHQEQVLSASQHC
jgi:hypothetical protein